MSNPFIMEKKKKGTGKGGKVAQRKRTDGTDIHQCLKREGAGYSHRGRGNKKRRVHSGVRGETRKTITVFLSRRGEGKEVGDSTG